MAEPSPESGFLTAIAGLAQQVAAMQNEEARDWFQEQVYAALRELKKRRHFAQGAEETDHAESKP